MSPTRFKRVPMLLQTSSTECGPACLTMILRHHGRRASIPEVSARAGVGRDGMTGADILRVADSYGLDAVAVSCGPDDLREVEGPAVLYWTHNHYVVLERWADSVDLIDPAFGRRRLPAEEAALGFSGVAFTFRKGDEFAETGRGDGSSPGARYIRGLLSGPGVPGTIAKVLGASAALQVLGLAVPLLTKLVVDYVVPGALVNVLSVMAIGALAVALARGAIDYVRSALLIRLQAELDVSLMFGFMERVLSLPYSFFQTRSSGDLLSRLNSNVLVRNMVTSQSVSALIDGALVSVYIVVLFVGHWLFGAAVVAVGSAHAVLVVATTGRISALTQEELISESASQTYLVEVLRDVGTFKVAGAERRALTRWGHLFRTNLRASLKKDRLAAAVGAAQGGLDVLAPLLLLLVGAWLATTGALTLGTALGLVALSAAVLGPLGSLVSQAIQLQPVGAHVGRIVDILEAAPEQEEGAGTPAPPLTGRIRVDDVSFSYGAAPGLRGVSFTVAPGQKVAIVGPTGSGKTTIGLLLLGLYEPESGRILYDGVDLADLNLSSFREQVGVVPQSPSFFNGTVTENITLGDSTVPVERVREAAHVAHILNDVDRMPMGFETILSEGGRGFSGGQLQRIALARAIVRDPAILLLDEATSHLDSLTEREVHRNIKSMDRTVVQISHRISTVVDSDLIVYVRDGRVVEAGTHAALVGNGGPYSATFALQSNPETP